MKNGFNLIKISVFLITISWMFSDAFAKPVKTTTFVTPKPIESPLISLSPSWYDRIHFSGQVKGVGFVSNHTPTTIGVLPASVGDSPHSSDLVITLASLGADAKLNNWFQTLLKMSYSQRSPSFVRSPAGGGEVFFVDQAIVIVENPEVSSFYSTIGRQIPAFGGFDSSSVMESGVQLLSFQRFTEILVGFRKTHGFKGAAYIFRGTSALRDDNSYVVRDYGFTLTFADTFKQLNYQLGADFINNMVGAFYINSTVANNSNLGAGNGYTIPVEGLDLNATATLGAFDATAKYVQALQAFSVNDVPFTNDGVNLFGAKPSAWEAVVGYSFPIQDHMTRFAVGYQGSRQSAAVGKAPGSNAYTISGVYGTNYAIGIPQTRYYIDYNYNFLKGVDLTFELDRDTGYGINHGGTGNTAYTGMAQINAQFG